MNTKPRVLIVEDDPIIAFDLAEELRTRGFASICVADNLRDALRAVGKDPPEAAVIDLMLADGETGATLASILARGGVKVFVTSAQTHPQRKLAAVQHIYMKKPVNADIVAFIIEHDNILSAV